MCDAGFVADATKTSARGFIEGQSPPTITSLQLVFQAMKISDWICLTAFPQSLVFWATCGACCALPSFVLAALGGYNVWALLVGTLVYIFGYALATASLFYQRRMAGRGLAQSLRFSAKVRAILSLFAALGFLGPEWLVVFGFLDFYPGVFAISFTSIVAGTGFGHGSSNTEFGWTLLTTLVQGGLISVQMFLLALVRFLIVRRRQVTT